MQAEQAKADRAAAEQARVKMAADMVLANERIAGLSAEVEEQSAKAMEARVRPRNKFISRIIRKRQQHQRFCRAQIRQRCRI